jgi:lysophospholipase L1-like esterase
LTWAATYAEGNGAELVKLCRAGRQPVGWPGRLRPGGAKVGWERRLAEILGTRTAVPCALTNLAADGADVTAVLEQRLPSVAGVGPDLVSVTVGMNDIREPGFRQDRFGEQFGRVLDSLILTGATVLTCILPDIAVILPLPAGMVGLLAGAV